MNPNQINAAIAEAVGYTDLYVTAPDRGSLTERVWGKINGLNRQVPNYHGDLNAMTAAVCSLVYHDHRRDFARRLHQIVCGMAAPDPHEDDFYCYNATAAQRAEAFLRALGKWEDGE